MKQFLKQIPERPATARRSPLLPACSCAGPSRPKPPQQLLFLLLWRKFNSWHFYLLNRPKQGHCCCPSLGTSSGALCRLPVEHFMLSHVHVWKRQRFTSAATTPQFLAFSLSMCKRPRLACNFSMCPDLPALCWARCGVCWELYTSVRCPRSFITERSRHSTNTASEVFKNKDSKTSRHTCGQRPLKLNVLSLNQFVLSIAMNSPSLKCDLLFIIAILKKQCHGNEDFAGDPGIPSDSCFLKVT